MYISTLLVRTERLKSTWHRWVPWGLALVGFPSPTLVVCVYLDLSSHLPIQELSSFVMSLGVNKKKKKHFNIILLRTDKKCL